MRSEAVPQRMWVHVFLEARPLGGFFASVPDHLGVDRGITGMPAVAWKQPYAGLSPQAAPVSFEFVEQLWAEQNILSLRPLPPWTWITMRLLSMSLTFRCVNSARRTPVA